MSTTPTAATMLPPSIRVAKLIGILGAGGLAGASICGVITGKASVLTTTHTNIPHPLLAHASCHRGFQVLRDSRCYWPKQCQPAATRCPGRQDLPQDSPKLAWSSPQLDHCFSGLVLVR